MLGVVGQQRAELALDEGLEPVVVAQQVEQAAQPDVGQPVVGARYAVVVGRGGVGDLRRLEEGAACTSSDERSSASCASTMRACTASVIEAKGTSWVSSTSTRPRFSARATIGSGSRSKRRPVSTSTPVTPASASPSTHATSPALSSGSSTPVVRRSSPPRRSRATSAISAAWVQRTARSTCAEPARTTGSPGRTAGRVSTSATVG